MADTTLLAASAAAAASSAASGSLVDDWKAKYEGLVEEMNKLKLIMERGKKEVTPDTPIATGVNLPPSPTISSTYCKGDASSSSVSSPSPIGSGEAKTPDFSKLSTEEINHMITIQKVTSSIKLSMEESGAPILRNPNNASDLLKYKRAIITYLKGKNLLFTILDIYEGQNLLMDVTNIYLMVKDKAKTLVYSFLQATMTHRVKQLYIRDSNKEDPKILWNLLMTADAKDVDILKLVNKKREILDAEKLQFNDRTMTSAQHLSKLDLAFTEYNHLMEYYKANSIDSPSVKINDGEYSDGEKVITLVNSIASAAAAEPAYQQLHKDLLKCSSYNKACESFSDAVKSRTALLSQLHRNRTNVRDSNNQPLHTFTSSTPIDSATGVVNATPQQGFCTNCAQSGHRVGRNTLNGWQYLCTAQIHQCQKCNRWGHQERFCKTPKNKYVKKDRYPDPNRRNMSSSEPQQADDKNNYKDEEDTNSSGLLKKKLKGKTAAVVGRVASIPSSKNESIDSSDNFTVILDTACTRHAFCNPNLFDNLRNANEHYIVEIADGSQFLSTKVGDVTLSSPDGDEFILKNVYYFPTFTMNLISWPSLDCAGFCLLSSDKVSTIYMRDGDDLTACLKLVQNNENKCYEYTESKLIKPVIASASATIGRGELIERYLTLHCQYAHAHAGDILALVNQGVIKSSQLSVAECQKIIAMQVKCEDCNASKSKQRPINDYSLRPLPTKPMERISADCFILGKLDLSIYRSEYVNVWDFCSVVSGILDEDSGCAEIAMVPSTGHATPHVINFLQKYSPLADNGIPMIKTTINADNAYLNHQLTDFVDKCGFKLSIAPPYAHQNVLIEQWWRRFKGSTKAAMRKSGAPKFTVNYFMKAVAFQINLLINTKYNISKFQRFYSFPPRNGVAHTPGCDVLVKYEEGEKFNLNVEKMHTEEAYLCAFLCIDFEHDQQMDSILVYDPIRIRIIRRRNCGPFYEDKFTIMRALANKALIPPSDSEAEYSSDDDQDSDIDGNPRTIVEAPDIDGDDLASLFKPSEDVINESNKPSRPPIDDESKQIQAHNIQRLIEAQEAKENIQRVERFMFNDRDARMARRAAATNESSTSSNNATEVTDDIKVVDSALPSSPSTSSVSVPAAVSSEEATQPKSQYVNPRRPTLMREHATRHRSRIHGVSSAASRIIKLYRQINNLKSVANIASHRRENYVSMKEALHGPEKEEFKAAMMDERQMLEDFKVFIKHNIHDIPKDATILPLLVLFTRKYDENGKIKKYKCRIALRGDKQTEDDYDEISSPVISPIAKKIIFALAVQYGLNIMQVDFKCAYLHAKMDKVMYVRIPPDLGIEGCDDPNNVYLLDKALYGARQSGLLFNKMVIQFMVGQGFTQSTYDKCLFFKITDTNNLFLVGLYVDDGEIAFHPIDEQSDYLPFMEALGKAFRIGEAGTAKWLLGIKVEYDKTDGLLELSQSAFIDKILAKLKLSNAKPLSTPSVQYAKDEDHSSTNAIPVGMREALGLFNWLTTSTRPDIGFAVNQIAHHVNDPQPIHHKMVKRLARYLIDTKELGLMYRRVDVKDFKIKVFVDAAFDTNKDSKSQTGFIIMLGGCNIYSKSTTQSIVAQSSAEAEYMAAAEASNAAVGIQETVNEIIVKLRPYSLLPPIEMFSDSAAAIQIASGNCTSTVKHIRRRYHVLRQRVQEGELNIIHLQTNSQPADALTKTLTADKFIPFRDQILGYALPEK